jgi:hypothetical protein
MTSKNSLRLAGLAVLFVLAMSSIVDIARAGDTEGVTGYSMRLKNKTFDGSDSSTGQSLVLPLGTKAAELPVIQETYRSDRQVRAQLTFLFYVHLLLRMIALR